MVALVLAIFKILSKKLLVDCQYKFSIQFRENKLRGYQIFFKCLLSSSSS